VKDSLKVGDEISLDKATIERLHRLHDSDIQKIRFDKGDNDIIIEIELCQCYGQPRPCHMLAEISFVDCSKINSSLELEDDKWGSSIQVFSQLNSGIWEFETHVAGLDNGYIQIACKEIPKLKVIKELAWRD